MSRSSGGGGPLSRSQQATLDALVDTFAPGDADVVGTRTAVAAALDRLAPHRRKRLLTALNLLAHPLALLALAGRPRAFARLDRAHRERAVLRMARIALLRPAFDAFARLSLFAAYGVGDAAGRSAVWTRLGYPGPRADVPAATAFPLAAPPLEAIAVDAVVVGSGAGGGVAAALLAQAGLRVAVLEAGPATESIAARQREAESFAELYLESGLAASEDLSVSVLAGACVGGGTAVNWSTSLRLPAERAAEWGASLDRPSFAAELAAAYDAVETRLGVTLATSHNRNNAVIVAGATKLGWGWRAIPRNAECQGDACGYCGFGCAYGNKRSTAATYLRDAHDAGALVYARTRVERVRIDAAAGPGERAVRGVDAVTEDGRTIGFATLHAEPLQLTAAEATPAGLDAFERELVRRADARTPNALFSAHQMGTARMGASAADGAIDPEGRVYGVAGLLVTDASAFPAASGVNPMLTIMALAHRATRALIDSAARRSMSGSPARSHS